MEARTLPVASLVCHHDKLALTKVRHPGSELFAVSFVPANNKINGTGKHGTHAARCARISYTIPHCV